MKKLAFVNQGRVFSVDEYSDEVAPGEHLVDVTAMNPQPEAGWPVFEGNIVQPYVLDRVQWFKRLLPHYADFEAAHAADSVVRAYTKMWEIEPALNLRRADTMAMVTAFAQKIIEITPTTNLTVAMLTAYGTSEEQYKVK